MSGGSYDYLCFKDAYEISNYREQLCKMRDKLTELGFKDAAKETESILLILDSFEVQVQARIDRLHLLWQAIEWEQSGDYGMEDVIKAVHIYRGE